MTAEEYLALDRAAEVRSEFLDGEMVAMSGGSLRHSRLQVKLARQLDEALGGSDCEAFSADLRVRVSRRMYVYPDHTVVCGKRGTWTSRDYQSAGDTLVIASIAVSLPIARIYEGIDFSAGE